MKTFCKTLLITAILGATAAGCSDGDTEDGNKGSGSTGTTGSEGAGGAGGGAAVGFAASPCGSCVHQSCQDAFDACYADPECPAYAECLDACPLDPAGQDADPTCAAACPRGTGTESKRAAAAIDACRDPGPGAACEACGIPPREGVPDVDFLQQECPASSDPDACLACQDEHCCDTYAACIADPECLGLRECFKAAGDYSDECLEQFPGGVAGVAEDFLCATYYCAIDQVDCDRSQRDPCLECAFTTCTQEWADFDGTAEGFLLGNCLGTCAVGDDGCDQACYDQYPEAAEASLAFGECLVAGCPEEC